MKDWVLIDGRRFWVEKRRIGMYSGGRNGVNILLPPLLMKVKAVL
jgi:hypothetical protein